ncbi:MAG: dihydroorotase [Fusobacteriaceae bacterium]
MLLVQNARIISGENSDEVVDILLGDDGKIFEIKNKINLYMVDNKKNKIIDAKFNLVISGVIDPHVHMRDPGLTHKEDFFSGSKACAKGGVTTFLDMPNSIPNTITEENLIQKKNICSKKSLVDYGFHFGGSKIDNSSEILKVKNSVASTKIFLNMSTGDMLIDNNKILENIFKSSKIISVHAEEEKVETAISFAEKFDCKLYLCHLSKKSEVELLRNAKKRGVKVFGEVTPHHLFFSYEDRERSPENKMLLNMKPDLKSKEDCDALWEGIIDGTIDTIGTDHAPHTLEEKLSKIIFGIPGVENSLEIMLSAVKSGKLSYKKLSEIMSENSAKIFGIKNKGKLEVGYDGDLVIIDTDDLYIVDNKKIISKCEWTPYSGMKTGGRVITTIIRGNIVYDNGKFFEVIGKEVEF